MSHRRSPILSEMGKQVRDMNLVVKFRLADGEVQVRAAARIRVDGRGGLTLFGTNGEADAIQIRDLQTFSIHSVVRPRLAAMAA
jgi:hypothetical protein